MGFSVNYIAGGRLDPPFMPTKVKPYIKGNRLVANDMGVFRMPTTVDFDAELISVAVGVSVYEPKDYWNVLLNDELICETIYTKDVPEGIYFLAVIPVKAGSQLMFEFNNSGTRTKNVWFNYQFLR